MRQKKRGADKWTYRHTQLQTVIKPASEKETWNQIRKSRTTRLVERTAKYIILKIYTEYEREKEDCKSIKVYGGSLESESHTRVVCLARCLFVFIFRVCKENMIGVGDIVHVEIVMVSYLHIRS